MNRINATSGSKITIYHTFHDEVAAQRTHVWQCNGSCRSRPPYFGKCSRSMNRPPGKNDTWYEEHRRTCGGVWTKVSEPPPKVKRPKPKSKKSNDKLPRTK